VTASGVWAEAQTQITLLLVIAGLVVLVVHDLLPTEALRSAKFGLEATLGLGLATVLVLLTGRQSSPFFLAFPLLVAGAALVVSSRATLVLAVAASLVYVLSIVLAPGADLGPATVSTVSVQIMSLVLLAYVAMVIARMQRRSRDAAIRMSTIDALTGLYNRPYLFSAIVAEIARSTRTGRGFCLLMMDLDELKTINDRYGHFVGDRALRAVADVIRFGVRRIDVPARYGGDEFVVLLPETDPTGGYVLGEKIRQSVAELVVPGTEVRTSMSVGMVSYPDDGRTADELMISADRAMYASKRLGKNRVMGAPTGAGGRADAPV
jgi:diguanylate cyclase (GGDEF)-like protein